ncbi:MAG: DUF5985 family protein [Bdellovibrionia bacterium]
MSHDRWLYIAFLSGSVCALSAVVSFFFYKAWSRSRDQLFYCFSWAFGLLAFERLLLTFTDPAMEIRPFFYLMRLVAFSTIIYGVWRKNQESESH